MRIILTVLAALSILPSWASARESSSAGDVEPTGRMSASLATCKSRAINYITDTLPQQCLASTRRPSVHSDTPTSGAGPYNVLSEPAEAVESGTYLNPSQTVPSPSGATSRTPVNVSTYDPSVISTTEPESSRDVTIATSASVPIAVTRDTTETDTDSPLDNVNFLSFEEWKRQNFAKSGQAPPEERVRSRRVGGSHDQSALDSLGDDAEINIDFSGFGAAQQAADELTQASPTASQALDAAVVRSGSAQIVGHDTPSVSPARSKDAGRTCKERTNYASIDCAATVLKSNKECKSASSVLIENKDSYMLNVCSAPDKYLIVEMCDDILIDTVVLANYEFFSSIFRTFRVSVSDRYPPKNDAWRDLGVFEARNTRQVQAFLVEQPLVWARFVKIEFLTHYGNEYYCPVSLLRIHGTTMLEEFKHQDEPSRSDELAPEKMTLADRNTIAQEEASASVAADESAIPVRGPVSVSETKKRVTEGTPHVPGQCTVEAFNMTVEWASCLPSSARTPAASSTKTLQSTTTLKTSHSTTTEDKGPTGPGSSTNDTASSVAPVTPEKLVQPASSSVQNVAQGDETSTMSRGRATAANTQINAGGNKTEPARHSSAAVSTSPPPPLPSTQESFYKSIHKRLQMLESNATLSLQYIEEQSRMLRDAFAKVEKRQVNKTESFLRELNRTVLAELAGFRTQYDHLWQSTVIELETHREQYQRELLAVSSRLNIVAEELLFQKRMVVFQSTLLILCLGLVIFARMGTTGLTLELPLLQQVLSKSSSYTQRRYAASGYIAAGDNSTICASPPLPDAPSPTSWRHSWNAAWSRAGQSPSSPEPDVSSGGEDEASASAQIAFQPPTPTRHDHERERDNWRPATTIPISDLASSFDTHQTLGANYASREVVHDPGPQLLESKSSPSTTPQPGLANPQRVDR